MREGSYRKHRAQAGEGGNRRRGGKGTKPQVPAGMQGENEEIEASREVAPPYTYPFEGAEGRIETQF